MFLWFNNGMNKPPFTQDISIMSEWDDDACVWTATSDDVPGLATEAATQEELIAKLKVMIPELLELNQSF